MYSLQILVLAVALLAFAALVLIFLRRASRARRSLAVNIHDRALALDRRCDVLREAIEAVTLRQRIDHLFALITCGESEGRLDPAVARRLRRYALELRAESLSAAGSQTGQTSESPPP